MLQLVVIRELSLDDFWNAEEGRLGVGCLLQNFASDFARHDDIFAQRGVGGLVIGQHLRHGLNVRGVQLSELDGVTEVGVCGTGVSIDSLDADATIRDLVGRGVEFRDLEITGAGLEQAFMALTQCALADAIGVEPGTTASAVAVGRENP